MTHSTPAIDGKNDTNLQVSPLRNFEMVWHYAPWAYLPAIVESGVLQASNAGAENEQPMLWFSANQQWEPTATKMITTKGGSLAPQTFKQQAVRLGCIRFGLAANDLRLLKWTDACITAGTPRKQRRKMENVGRRMGGNPAHWFASAESISLPELHFQVWHDAWCDTTSPQDMAAVWTEVRGN
jgi:hypothetical protein